MIHRNRLLLLVVVCLIIPALLLGACATQRYTLTSDVDPGPEAGSINPGTGAYKLGEKVYAVAYPKLGWTFDHWEGDASGTENSFTVVMDSDKYIKAVFVREE